MLFLCFVVLICKHFEVPLRFEGTFCSGLIKAFLYGKVCCYNSK